MKPPVRLTKADARRALVRHQFTPCGTQMEVFERLRSIQFDPIAPAGGNHDLVLQARLPGYRVGDWNHTAYNDRLIYDGWDKQASLVPFEGWPVRRLFHDIYRRNNAKKIFEGHPEAVEAVLEEVRARGPLMPGDFEFQERKEGWKESWYGPSVTKQTLRALWHAGLLMTAARKNGQHLYDLAERVVPAHLFNQPQVPEPDAIRELVLERHRAMGLVRPGAPYEVWSYQALTTGRKAAIGELVAAGALVPVDVEGVAAHATPECLQLLELPSLEPRALFVAPLDPLLWDRKMVGHVFGFDYIWEIYKPEAKRRWGYYVLPILFGDELVARVEFHCRAGVLEVRQWHEEEGGLPATFWPVFEQAVQAFMGYCSATKVSVAKQIPSNARASFKAASG